MPGMAALLLLLWPSMQRPEGIRWYFSPERAFQAARDRRQPVMLDLVDARSSGFDWFDAFVLSDPRIGDAAQNRVVPLRLNVADAGKPFFDRYNVPACPAVLFLTADGKPYWRIVGRIGPDGFSAEIDRAIRLLPSLPRYEQTIRKRTGSSHDLGAASCMALAAGDEQTARDLLQRARRTKPMARMATEATIALADQFRLGARYGEALPLLESAANDPNPVLAARALYGIASCRWRTGRIMEAANVLKKLDAMGDSAGDYRFLAGRMVRRLGMVAVR